MREYKFRGKDRSNAEWVYGFYINFVEEGEEKHCLIDERGRWVEIFEQTLGQYIRRDKNGEEIYEGDLMEGHGEIMQVVYDNGSFVAQPLTRFWKKYYAQAFSNYVKVGNRFDNPELL